MSRPRRVACGYCHRDAELVNGSVVYPHRPEFVSKRFWRCAPCKAHVGCHPGTVNPLGRLANAELRKAKQRVHELLDPIWKSGRMKRTEAYAALAAGMAIAPQNCHIGMFDLTACETAIAVLNCLKQEG